MDSGNIISSLNKSQILLAFTAIMSAAGAKYLHLDVTPTCENFLKKPYMRKLIVFSIAFISTRNIKIAAMATVLFALIFNVLLI